MATYTDVYLEEGVIAFVPDDLDADPDFGKIGVFAREKDKDKDKGESQRLFFYPWLVAQRSKSAHVLGTPVTRIAPNMWRLQDNDTTGASGWFDPLVPTEPYPLRLRRVAKTKARTLATQPVNDWDGLEYAPDHSASAPDPVTKESTASPASTTPDLLDLNDSSESSPHG